MHLFLALLFSLTSVFAVEEGLKRIVVTAEVDKPVYRAGETVYARAVMLRALDLKPLAGHQGVTFKIRDGRGQEVYKSAVLAHDSVAGISWTLPPEARGGAWSLHVSCGGERSKRSFAVRGFERRRFDTTVAFARKAYGPGEIVEAAVQVKRLLGGLPTGTKVTARAMVDGESVKTQELEIEKVQQALDVLVQRQLSQPDQLVAGWAVTGRTGPIIDTATSTWCVLALRSGKAAGLDVYDGLEGARMWLEHVWKLSNPDFLNFDRESDRSVFPASWNSETGEVHRPTMNARALFMAIMLGFRSDDILAETLANSCMARLPASYPLDAHQVLFSTYGIFQLGGARWQLWNGNWRDLAVGSQRRGQGCFDGSWDPSDYVGVTSGRLLSTALIGFSLQCYYRYLPIDRRREQEWTGHQTRIFAHRRRSAGPGRDEFMETIGWWAGVATDPKTGQAEVRFDLPDQAGQFSVRADGFDECSAPAD